MAIAGATTTVEVVIPEKLNKIRTQLSHCLLSHHLIMTRLQMNGAVQEGKMLEGRETHSLHQMRPELKIAQEFFERNLLDKEYLGLCYRSLLNLPY